MFLCNDTITLFNAFHDPENDEDVWYKTIINGVSWYDKYIASVTANGLKSSETYVIRIPEDVDAEGKSYIDPMAYAELGNWVEHYTLRVGDIIVKGAIEAEDVRPATLHASNFKCMTILGVIDNRRALNAPHFKVTGA